MDEILLPITEIICPGIKDGYLLSNKGYIINTNTNTILNVSNRGISSLQNKNNKSFGIHVGRLIYKVFIDPRLDNKIIIVTKDGSNNFSIDNIQAISKMDYKTMQFERNVELNTGHSNAYMSGRTYYQNKKKAMCHYIDEYWVNITEQHILNLKPWYLVSNYGRIYSKATDSIMKTGILNSGYIRVQLIDNNNHKMDLLVHRIVAIVFIYNDDPINKTEVNHINENPFDNRVCNLEWVTPLQNQLYSSDNQRTEYYKQTFTDNIVHAICKALENNMPYVDICNKILHCAYDPMLHKRIYKIHKHQIHTDISEHYKF